MARRVVTVAMVGGLAVGCTVGPAANRADRETPDAPPPLTTSPPQETEGGEPNDPSATPTETEAPPPEPTPAPAEGTASVAETLADGLGADACCIAELPDGSLLIGQRASGVISRVSLDGTTTEVATMQSNLLGLAAQPTSADGDTIDVAVFRLGSGGNRVEMYGYLPNEPEGQQWLSAPDNLLRDIPTADAHNGGALAFGPDGALYIGTGDAAQPQLATDPDSLGGKILRIAPDGSVPADNPVPGSPVYSSGHTDVRGLAWDGDRMWALDANAIQSVRPGGSEPQATWTAATSESLVGLAAGQGCLWLPSAGGLLRFPLNGTELVTPEPQPLLPGELPTPQALLPTPDGTALWALTNGALTQLAIT